MLVLSRKIGETICIGNQVDVVVLGVTGGRVKLGFACPRDVSIRRGELAVRKPDALSDAPAVTIEESAVGEAVLAGA